MASLPPQLGSKRIALCYVRLSQARDGADAVSPERQRANILAKCQELGYTPEWYADVEGHKSGREVKNRPGWQALTERLSDPDVVALIGNDLARFHRKGWRVGDLVEFVEAHHIDLILAAPGRQIETASPMGKVFVYLTAIFDEFYAEDISFRVKDSIQHRKALGKSVGRPPFGTTRDRSGYLMPNLTEGAWWLVSGQFVAGVATDCPEADAIWRTYYESAQRALTLFAGGTVGVEKLAYQLNAEGYPFCDRHHQPRRWDRDDVRRVLANWPEYGGLVLDRKAKDRVVLSREEVQQLPLVADKAVFPLELLQQVGLIRSERTLLAVDRGQKTESFPYPLSHLTRCAHCEQLVEAHTDPRLRTHLAGTQRAYGRVYRHKPGVECGCSIRSVPCEVLEADFGQLLQGLQINTEVLAQVLDLAEQQAATQEPPAPDMRAVRQRQIVRLQQKIANTKQLFREAEIEATDYHAYLTEYRAELAYWETYTTDQEQVNLQLSRCLQHVEQMAQLWTVAEPAERRLMAHNLFDYLVYNLETQRILDFRLKPWANVFLVWRAAIPSVVKKKRLSNREA